MYRLGVQAALADDGRFALTGEASCFEDVCEQAPALMPDVVLMDAQLPGLVALDSLQTLRPLMPHCRFVLLLPLLSPELVRAAIAAGAACLLAKTANQEEIVSAIKPVHGGEWTHPDTAIQALRVPQAAPDPQVRLTPRERDLLVLMAQGLSNAEIASRLSIAMPTVKFHVGHIMAKLGVENRTAAVLVALRQQLVDLHGSGTDAASNDLMRNPRQMAPMGSHS